MVTKHPYGDLRRGKKKGVCMSPAQDRERARLIEAWKRTNDPRVKEREKLKSRILGPRITEFNKEAVMNVYTNGEQTCRYCGHGDLDVLCLDHVENDGADHRRALGKNPATFSGAGMYNWVIKNDYPPIFQVLCSNCNLKKEVLKRRANRKGNGKTAW